MRGPSSLPAADAAVLKAAFRELVKACGGPDRAARFTAATATELVRYGDENRRFFPTMHVIADLEAEAGEPIVTRALADVLGLGPPVPAGARQGAPAAIRPT